jgi:hypothetical protein
MRSCALADVERLPSGRPSFPIFRAVCRDWMRGDHAEAYHDGDEPLEGAA